jgi:hypothetical protein
MIWFSQESLTQKIFTRNLLGETKRSILDSYEQEESTG